MTQITLEIPDDLFSQLETKKDSLQAIFINALKNYLAAENFDITKTKTYELCGSLEVNNIETDKFPETENLTNYAENIDQILYS